ncbi:MAG: hypothetical protein GY852_10375 [bacterium]|nr:hypothetical protein [bacterium]
MRKGPLFLMFLLIASGLAFSLTYFGPGTPLDCSTGQVDISIPDTYSWNFTGANRCPEH